MVTPPAIPQLDRAARIGTDLELFRALLDRANDAVEIIDPETGRFLDVNERAAKIVGYSREEHLRLTVADLDPPFDGPVRWRNHVQQLKKTGCLVFETWHRRKDRTIFPVEISASYVRQEREYIVAIVRDISERRNSEQHIRQLNRVYAVLSGINVLIVRERNLRAIYEGACHIAVEAGGFRLAWVGLRKDPSQPVEVAAHAGASPDTLEALRDLFQSPELGCAFTRQALASGRNAVCNDIAADPLAAPWRHLALERGYLSMVCLPLIVFGKTLGAFNLYSDERGFFDEGELRLLDELAADISFAAEISQREIERRRLEEQFRQSQKMEAIGLLAGGVAHDFNNILAAMMMQSEIILSAPQLPAAARDGLAQMRAYSERAATLTRQLLLFSRKQVMQPHEIDLNDIAAGIANMLQRIVGEQFAVQTSLLPHCVWAFGDAGMIEQVLMNLVVNARDAMPDGGAITIETGEATVSEPEAMRLTNGAPGDYVWLRVADSGCGIPPENVQHIFEPFFTTKPLGKGTGLGLATVFGIVQQHRGMIGIQTQVGKGTAFQVYFPRITAKSSPPGSAATKAHDLRGAETILLTEDDVSLRGLTRTILENAGYRVLEAADASHAQRLWQESREPVKLLFTDVVLPGRISGWELAAKLLEKDPALKVVLVSGYSPEQAAQQVALQPNQRFLQKPYPTQLLLETVRDCLDQ